MADILIIDDDDDLRASARRILERAGHEVREAENGRIGLNAIHEREPDLVITDLIMPEKEGIETILELREEFAELPILAVSGVGYRDDTEGPLADAMVLGADAVLAKPFSVEDLTEAVERLLG